MTNGDAIRDFESRFFSGRLNRFIGSGGELLIKADADAPATRMDIGDRLIGIGATHVIENLDVPPGPDAFHATTTAKEAVFTPKCAARAFRVTAKESDPDGFRFGFEPLAPSEYSQLLEQVSDSRVRISPATIPEGTIILSFIDTEASYTLRTIKGSPGANWAAATSGPRHWNVGIGKTDDYWVAQFPSDDVGALSVISRADTLGTIRFGLSLLDGSVTYTKLSPVSCTTLAGDETRHDFCLDGAAAGTAGVNTPFPIGVRTAIRFRPTVEA